jgi:hypothetical protein
VTRLSEDDRWQALSPHRTELDGPLTGWRFWHAGGRVLDGHPLQPKHGRWIEAVLVEPQLSASEDSALAISGTSVRYATCRRYRHQAPADGCTCGYRIVRQLPELAAYLRHLHRASAPHETDIPVAMVKVRGLGAAMLGSDSGSDSDDELQLPLIALPEPERTAWVERMTIIGPIHLPPGIEHAAPAFERQFGVPVIAWHGGNIWGWYEALIAGKGDSE